MDGGSQLRKNVCSKKAFNYIHNSWTFSNTRQNMQAILMYILNKQLKKSIHNKLASFFIKRTVSQSIFNTFLFEIYVSFTCQLSFDSVLYHNNFGSTFIILHRIFNLFQIFPVTFSCFTKEKNEYA